MRTFTFNALLFLFVYLPLTLVLGLSIDAFRVDGADDAAGYEFFLWFVVTIQMLVPTLVLFTVVYFAISFLGRRSNAAGRRSTSIGVVGLSLPLVQAFLWAGTSFSLSWLVVAVLPALLLGGIVKYSPIAMARCSEG